MSSKKKELHEERVKKQKFKEKNKLRIIIPVILVMLVVVLFIGYRIKKTLEPAGHKVTTVSKASL
jgi:hypothetical protein